MSDTRLMTVGEVAGELGVSRYRIHQMIRGGRFPSAHQADYGQRPWLIDARDLDANRERKNGRPKQEK